MKYIIHYLNFSLIILVISCSSESNDKDKPLKKISVAAAEDEKKISDYLNSHFYNYEDFQNPNLDFDYKVRIDTLRDATKKPLSKQVQTKTVTIDDIKHKAYFIVVKEGKGNFARFTDSILVRYRGEDLRRNKFDGSDYSVWFDTMSLVAGWQKLISEFKTGSQDFVKNNDGTITFPRDYGIGIIIFPSKLGYFQRSIGKTGAYSPLVFSFDLLRTHFSDHDRDGIPSYEEDINKNGDAEDDDTDNDKIPNYRDADDDGDGTLTKDEYDADKDGTVDDYDGDGIPDYLDNK